jgi:tRNA pseudouridine38-40 synthase
VPRLLFTISYNGTRFYGWQVQPDLKTVQGTIQEVLSKVLRRSVEIVASGRTDQGVHAIGQCFHVDLLDEERFITGQIHRINTMLIPDISIRKIEVVPDDFHARFSPIYRQYVFRFSQFPQPLSQETVVWHPKSLHIDRMMAVSQHLLGTHDFAGFSKANPDNYTTICGIHYLDWREIDGIWEFRIRANRFLHHMVRSIMGTLFKVGEGLMTEEQFQNVLNLADRSACGPTAPAKGLCLESVGLPEIHFENGGDLNQ